MHRKGPPHRRARGRRRAGDRWIVQAPISRIVEPALLLALKTGPSHGYELADAVAEIIGVDRVDYGNLYRLLRGLEAEGIVVSTWDSELEGRSKRTYELTNNGSELLDAWAGALQQTKDGITTFLSRYQKGSP